MCARARAPSPAPRPRAQLAARARACRPLSLADVGVDFMVYGTLRELLPVDSSTGQPATVPKLVAGAIAGAVGQTVAYPLDTIR